MLQKYSGYSIKDATEALLFLFQTNAADTDKCVNVDPVLERCRFNCMIYLEDVKLPCITVMHNYFTTTVSRDPQNRF